MNVTLLSEITKMNEHSSSFDFLKDEPELYTKEDVKKEEEKESETKTASRP